MRSAIIAAAFAAGALAVPHQKRAMVTQVDIDYVTEIITVTAGQPLPTSVAAAAVTTLAAAAHFGNHDHIQPKPAPQVSSSVVVEAVVVTPQAAAATPASQSFNIAVQPQPQQQQQQQHTSSSSGSSNQPASSGSSSGGSSNIATSNSGSAYQNMVINSHNLHRANHSAPAIEWDDGLAATAQIIGQTCRYEHQMDTNGGGYGQNIAAGLSPENVDKVITNMFYNGEVSWFDGLYGQANPNMGNFKHWGHFSQLVWKASTKVGCATVDCSSGLKNFGNDNPYFTVCNYDSAGNFGGQYGDNIGEPLGHPTVVA